MIDGTGRDRQLSDILLENGKIARIAQPDSIDPSEIEDVIMCEEDWIAAPGFIDTHSHADFSLFYDPAQKTKLLQGVTTEIEGNCGVSAAPTHPDYIEHFMSNMEFLGSDSCIPRETLLGFKKFSDYLKAVENLELGINSGFLIGHGTVRMSVMGMDGRKPSSAELDKMIELVSEGMEHGALGMSSGLIYPPGVFADSDELLELCKVVAAHNGVYSTHMRNESYQMLASVQESLDIARDAKCRVLISHHKVTAKERWGDTATSLKMIENANAAGFFVRADVYPYAACGTAMSSLIPPEFHAGGIKSLLRRLSSSEDRKQIEARILSDDTDWDNPSKAAGLENILIIDEQKNPAAFGKTIAEYAQSRGISDVDALFELLIENKGDSVCIEFCMNEQDVQRVLAHPLTMIGSDGCAALPGLSFHPRTTGTFPRVLGRYVREHKIFTLEEAVRKMTGLPAETYRLSGKGFLKEGYDADLVLLNHKTVTDKSDYKNAALPPDGIEYVILGGRIAIHKNRYTGDARGQVVKNI